MRLGSTRTKLVAGVDVGGTKTLAAVFDGTLQPVADVRRPTDVSGDLVGFLSTILVDVATAAGIDPGSLDGVGVGLPGLVDPATGVLRHAVNLGIGDDPVDLVGPLGRLVAGPVRTANDVNLATLGAAELLGLSGDVAYLSIGTGIALGLVLGGEIRPGARGAAGEIGHLPVDPYGPVCRCGQRGCLETVASGAAISRRWPRQAGNGDTADEASAPAAALLQAAAAGDPRAVAVRDDVCDHLAGAVALVAQAVDPDVVVLGGGVAEAGDLLLAGVRAALDRRAARSAFVASLDLAARLVVLPPGLAVGALGAARAALDLAASPQ